MATLYRQAAGISVFEITIIESISLALCIALEMPWGLVADRIGYRKTMIITCGIYFISKVVFWKADGFDGFLLERLLLSVVMAGMSGCDLSILYLSCREEESQQVFGVYQSLGMVGLLFASLSYSVFIGQNYRLGITLLEETNQTITVFLNQPQYVKCGSTDRATVLSIYAVIGEACGTGTNLIFGKAAAADLTYAMLWGSLLCTVGGLFFVISHLKMDTDN